MQFVRITALPVNEYKFKSQFVQIDLIKQIRLYKLVKYQLTTINLIDHSCYLDHLRALACHLPPQTFLSRFGPSSQKVIAIGLPRIIENQSLKAHSHKTHSAVKSAVDLHFHTDRKFSISKETQLSSRTQHSVKCSQSEFTLRTTF